MLFALIGVEALPQRSISIGSQQHTQLSNIQSRGCLLKQARALDPIESRGFIYGHELIKVRDTNGAGMDGALDWIVVCTLFHAVRRIQSYGADLKQSFWNQD